MTKVSDDGVDAEVGESSIDVESTDTAPKKPNWFSRFWGTSELDAIERRYVNKVDWYLL